MIYLIFVLISMFNTLGQILLKIGARQQSEKPSFFKIFLNPYSFCGYALFFVVTVFSVYLLKIIDLKLIVIIISMNYVFILIASVIFLKEKLTRNKLIATLFILLGIGIFNL